MHEDPTPLSQLGGPVASLLEDLEVADLGEPVELRAWQEPGSAVPARASGPATLKLIVPLLALVVGAGWMLARRGDTQEAPTQLGIVSEQLVDDAPPVAEAPSRAEPASAVITPSAVPAPDIDAPKLAEAPAPNATPPRHGTAKRASSKSLGPEPRAPEPPKAEPNPPLDELSMVAQMRGALASDPATALELARLGQRSFPSGMFVRERQAYEVLALFALGRHDQATTLARRFVARYPTGPLSERIQAQLSAPSG